MRFFSLVTLSSVDSVRDMDEDLLIQNYWVPETHVKVVAGGVDECVVIDFVYDGLPVSNRPDVSARVIERYKRGEFDTVVWGVFDKRDQQDPMDVVQVNEFDL